MTLVRARSKSTNQRLRKWFNQTSLSSESDLLSERLLILCGLPGGSSPLCHWTTRLSTTGRRRCCERASVPNQQQASFEERWLASSHVQTLFSELMQLSGQLLSLNFTQGAGVPEILCLWAIRPLVFGVSLLTHDGTSGDYFTHMSCSLSSSSAALVSHTNGLHMFSQSQHQNQKAAFDLP